MTRRLTYDETVEALRHGRVVAVPTDTVYGVAAGVWSLLGVAALFALKRRPRDVALPVLVAGIDELSDLDVVLDERAQRLAGAFWPGALTLVVTAPPALAAAIGASDQSVGLRVPKDEALLALLRDVGPMVVTSANDHGEPPCTSADEVLEVFAGRDGWAGVLDDGPRDGEVSTVLDARGETWQVLRHGAISESAIAEELARPE